MPQIPELRTHQHGEDDAVRGAAETPPALLLPARADMVRIVRCLRFVKQIGSRDEPVRHQLEVGIELELQLGIGHALQPLVSSLRRRSGSAERVIASGEDGPRSSSR